MDQDEMSQELMKNTTDTMSAASLRTVRNPLADCPPHANKAARAQNRKHQSTYVSMDLPNGLSS
jgi:hypothetical protein